MDELIAINPKAIAALHEAIEKGLILAPYAFARLTGSDERSVHRAWKAGSLPNANGEIPMREGLVALVSMDGMRRNRKVPQFLRDAEARARELLGLPPREDSQNAPESELAQWKLKYLMTQTALKKLTAEAKQRENEIAKGNLIPRAEVELDAAECATNVIGVLARIPERVSGMCVGCTQEEIARILRREIKLAVDAIQMSAFTGDWEGVEL